MSICSTHSSGAGPRGHRVAERVEIADQQFERGDAQLTQLGHVGVQPEVGEQTGVDVRMQGLDPTVQALGEAGHLLHRRHRQPGLDQGARGRSGRDQFDPGIDQQRADLGEIALVVHRDQRPPDPPPTGISHEWVCHKFGHGLRTCFRHRSQRTFRSVTRHDCVASRWTVATRSSRSATLIRSCRTSTVSESMTGTAHLVDDHPGVDSGVDHDHGCPGDLDSVRQGVAGPVHAREGRQQGRVGVERPAAEALEEAGPSSRMNPAQITRSGRCSTHGVRELAIPRRAIRGRLERVHEDRQPHGPRPLQAGDAVPIGADRHHRAPYPASYFSSPLAFNSACRRVPVPEINTTSRCGPTDGWAGWVVGAGVESEASGTTTTLSASPDRDLNRPSGG